MRQPDSVSKSTSLWLSVKILTDFIDDNVRVFRNVPYAIALTGIVIAGAIFELKTDNRNKYNQLARGDLVFDVLEFILVPTAVIRWPCVLAHLLI